MRKNLYSMPTENETETLLPISPSQQFQPLWRSRDYVLLWSGQAISSIIIGLLFTIGGIGTLGGALLSSVFSKRLSLGLLIRGICWGLVVAWLLLALAAPLIVLALSLSSLMLLRNMYAGVQFSYRLSEIPDQLLGRVNSAFRLIALGSTPVGLALGDG